MAVKKSQFAEIIEKNAYNLNIPRYIDSSEVDKNDIHKTICEEEKRVAAHLAAMGFEV